MSNKQLNLAWKAKLQSNDAGGCYPSTEALAEKCGMARETVSRCITSMRKKGLLEVKSGKRNTNNYSLKIEEYLAIFDNENAEKSCQNHNGDVTHSHNSNTQHVTISHNSCHRDVTHNHITRDGASQLDVTHNHITRDGASQLYINPKEPSSEPSITKQCSAGEKRIDELMEKIKIIFQAATLNHETLITAGNSEIQRWLANEMDVELDILPIITSLIAKANAANKKITKFSYFTDAIADAKATRTAPMPLGKPTQPQGNQRDAQRNQQPLKPKHAIASFLGAEAEARKLGLRCSQAELEGAES